MASWVRLDASLASNHKVLALMGERGGDHAVCVYVFGLGYCMAQDNAGFIPKAALGLIHGRTRDAQLLTEVGMWEGREGGWEVHDWMEYQPHSDEANVRKTRAMKAAAARWGKKEPA